MYSGCGVRSVWVDNALKEINTNIINKNINVIATGCFSSIEPEKIKKSINSKKVKVLTFSEIMKNYTSSSVEKVDEILSQNESINYEGTNNQRKRINETKLLLIEELKKIDRKYNLNLTLKYKEITKGFVFYNEDEPTEFITITRGCPYKCSYCSIPIGRGGEYKSVPLGNIIKKIDNAIEKGINKILLIGDEIGNYGLGTNGLDFSRLLEMIFENYNIIVGIRYLEPKPFIKHYETIKKYCLLGKIKLLYIPLQSGSNDILKLMNRSYKITDELINKIRFLRTNTNTVSYTNWMIGFNNESNQDFEKTIALAKELNFQINMVIPFSERPNTSAENIKNKVSIEEKERRHKELFNVVKNLKKNLFEQELKNLNLEEEKKILDLIIESENYEVLYD
jgi:tRNA A37 methylthiotransferase MiaB